MRLHPGAHFSLRPSLRPCLTASPVRAAVPALLALRRSISHLIPREAEWTAVELIESEPSEIAKASPSNCA